MEDNKVKDTKKKKDVTKEQPTKRTSTKKQPQKTTSKEQPKKVTVKKTPVKKVIDPRTGQVVVAGKKEPVKKETASKAKDAPLVKKTTRKKALPKKSSKELTIELPKKEVAEIVRPTPKKSVKDLSKDDKVLYKQLLESFIFVANMTNVIEDRTMDRKSIPDLAIGELHVIETVNKNNNKPMTLIARKEHVTVGALTTCVNRLVQKGYLLRTRDEMDHRVILLSVTQKAKKVIKVHDKFYEDILGLTLEGVTIAQLTKSMHQLSEVLETYYDPSLLEEAKTPKKKKKK